MKKASPSGNKKGWNTIREVLRVTKPSPISPICMPQQPKAVHQGGGFVLVPVLFATKHANFLQSTQWEII